MMRHRSVMAGLAVIACIAAAACTTTSHGPSGTASKPVSGGTATFAELPGGQITYIFPIPTCPADTSQNIGTFQNLLFEPLYTFADGSSVALNERVSMAYAPVYSDNDTKVTVRLKNYKWSNGENVDAQDVVFWQNLITASKTDDCNYVPGYYPDNVVSVKADGPMQVTFTLNHSYSPTWFTYNELSQIVPLPMAWDKVSSASDGTCASTVSDCTAVYKYLSGQANQLSAYATNPLWKVVDGPWTLKSFSVDGAASFVPNKTYSGPDKPHLSQFNEAPFVSTSSEYDTLEAGNTIQVGYVPFEDAPANGADPLGSAYQIASWPIWGFGYIPMNEHNPKLGAVFQQVYFRQAMQHLLDQQAVVKYLLRGYGAEGTGPVPSDVPDPYLASQFRTDPFPFSVADAKALLTAHGWRVSPGGVTTCQKPGTGASDCGAGVASGTPLVLSLVFANAPTWVGQSVQDLKSVAAQVGIKINLSSAPANSVIGDISVCTAKQSSCSWQMLDWGSPGWTYFPDYYPSGEDLFMTGSGENDGSYSNAEMNKLLTAVIATPGAQSLNAYDQYVREQVPDLWQPTSAYQITAIASDLKGVLPQSPLDSISPQDWYYTK
jgi:peptide/nickel transport system substrate-binding protein